MTVPARIGRLTQGGIQSIALIESDENTAKLLTEHWNTPSRVYWLIDGGDILRFTHDEHNHTYTTNVVRTAPPSPAIDHPDNDWPDTGQTCIYAWWQDTWWKREAREDHGWPSTWEPAT